jgi:hypothetical protein
MIMTKGQFDLCRPAIFEINFMTHLLIMQKTTITKLLVILTGLLAASITVLDADTKRALYDDFYLVQFNRLERADPLYNDRDRKIQIEVRNNGNLEIETARDEVILPPKARVVSWGTRIEPGKPGKNHTIGNNTTFLTKYNPSQTYLITILAYDNSMWKLNALTQETVDQFRVQSSSSEFALEQPIQREEIISGERKVTKLYLNSWRFKPVILNKDIKSNEDYLVVPHEVVLSSDAFPDESQDGLRVAIILDFGTFEMRFPEDGYWTVGQTPESFSLPPFKEDGSPANIFLQRGGTRPFEIKIVTPSQGWSKWLWATGTVGLYTPERTLISKEYRSWVFAEDLPLSSEGTAEIRFKTFGPIFK